MRLRKSVCVLLAAMLLTSVGCGGKRTVSDKKEHSSIENVTEETKETYTEVKIFYGESATFGNMTLTVDAVEDPSITMEDTGRMVIFFHVKIDNGTEEVVSTNYLNNFSLTVDGTYFEPTECFTIPAGAKLYDYYGDKTFANEIEPGGSYSGYLAAEVDPEFKELQLHYTPKTTDRESRITVALSRENVTAAQK